MNTFYENLLKQLQALCANETDLIANLSNISACLNINMKELNWVGFYLYKNQELVLGPFQGRPACIRIPIGKGVCGTCVQQMKPIRVDNVHEFSGHIACDSASNSEIVLPLIKDEKCLGVLDIDSYKFARFDQNDEDGLASIAAYISTLF